MASGAEDGESVVFSSQESMVGINDDSTSSLDPIDFMAIDKVKFRQAVEPGDSIKIRVKLAKIRKNKIATATGDCLVNDKVVSSAELMFMLVHTND